MLARMFIEAHVLTFSSSIFIHGVGIPMIIHNPMHNFDHMATLPKASQRLMINTCYYEGMWCKRSHLSSPTISLGCYLQQPSNLTTYMLLIVYIITLKITHNHGVNLKFFGKYHKIGRHAHHGGHSANPSHFALYSLHDRVANYLPQEIMWRKRGGLLFNTLSWLSISKEWSQFYWICELHNLLRTIPHIGVTNPKYLLLI